MNARQSCRSVYLIVATTILFISCTKEDQPSPATPSPSGPDTSGYVRYLIKAGNNYCENNSYPLLTLRSLSFRAIFDSSAIYTNTTPGNQQDINKLYGFSDSTTHHHRNSARFGWNWYNNQLHIHAYTYVHGERRYKELGTIPLGQPSEYSISVQPGIYYFTLNGHTDTMARGCDLPDASGYKLFPYFGGDEPAPHDVTILVKEVN